VRSRNPAAAVNRPRWRTFTVNLIQEVYTMHASIRSGLVLSVAALAILGGCATESTANKNDTDMSAYEQYAGAPVRDFHSYRLDSWEAVGRNKLVVWTGVSEAYLLTVWDTCPNLQFANRVGVSSTMNSVSTLDKVLVGHDRCPISEIRPIDIKRMKADRAAKAAQAAQPATAP
jgi:hypothetical protein